MQKVVIEECLSRELINLLCTNFNGHAKTKEIWNRYFKRVNSNNIFAYAGWDAENNGQAGVIDCSEAGFRIHLIDEDNVEQLRNSLTLINQELVDSTSVLEENAIYIRDSLSCNQQKIIFTDVVVYSSSSSPQDILGREHAWTNNLRGHQDQLVAVIDSGVDLNCTSLKSALETYCSNQSIYSAMFHGLNLACSRYAKVCSPQDTHGHGTIMACFVASNASNAPVGAAAAIAVGMAPGCELIPVKIVEGTNVASSGHIAAGIYLAVKCGAKILTIASTFPELSCALHSALKYAQVNGCLCVCAAGNTEGVDQLQYPGGHSSQLDNVICVGASDKYFVASAINNKCTPCSILAPGEGLDIANVKSDVVKLEEKTGVTGTSFATPLAAGALVLAWQYYQQRSDTEISPLDTWRKIRDELKIDTYKPEIFDLRRVIPE